MRWEGWPNNRWYGHLDCCDTLGFHHIAIEKFDSPFYYTRVWLDCCTKCEDYFEINIYPVETSIAVVKADLERLCTE
jgi:hypothetical protein